MVKKGPPIFCRDFFLLYRGIKKRSYFYGAVNDVEKIIFFSFLTGEIAVFLVNIFSF